MTWGESTLWISVCRIQCLFFEFLAERTSNGPHLCYKAADVLKCRWSSPTSKPLSNWYWYTLLYTLLLSFGYAIAIHYTLLRGELQLKILYIIIQHIICFDEQIYWIKKCFHLKLGGPFDLGGPWTLSTHDIWLLRHWPSGRTQSDRLLGRFNL